MPHPNGIAWRTSDFILGGGTVRIVHQVWNSMNPSNVVVNAVANVSVYSITIPYNIYEYSSALSVFPIIPPIRLIKHTIGPISCYNPFKLHHKL